MPGNDALMAATRTSARLDSFRFRHFWPPCSAHGGPARCAFRRRHAPRLYHISAPLPEHATGLLGGRRSQPGFCPPFILGGRSPDIRPALCAQPLASASAPGLASSLIAIAVWLWRWPTRSHAFRWRAFRERFT